MIDKWQFIRNRLKERLWIKPLGVCVLSIGVALLASIADGFDVKEYVFDISADSVETLLQVMSSSMLVIATLAVASMVAAYAAASETATPRSFPLLISDDVSKNALSTFVGAFIFSIVALMAIKNGYYQQAGRFVLFALTLIVFALVIVTFVTWVDNIARLGRLGSTVKKVEVAAEQSLRRRKKSPTMGGITAQEPKSSDVEVCGDAIGYVQRCDIAALQSYAKEAELRITVVGLPGTFATPGRPLARVSSDSGPVGEFDAGPIQAAFVIGADRKFDEDPRFGLIVLSEIACRALSPAVNDPGTAIDVIGSLVRLFAVWTEPAAQTDSEHPEPEYPLIAVTELLLEDMLDDAFRAIARDGAGMIEVAVRLQKAFQALTLCEDSNMREVAKHRARIAVTRAEAALQSPSDLTLLQSVAQFAKDET